MSQFLVVLVWVQSREADERSVVVIGCPGVMGRHLFGTQWVFVLYWDECLLVVSACQNLHVCTVCIWRCEHTRFCVEVVCAPYIHFHSFIQTTEASVAKQNAAFFWPKDLQLIMPKA